MTLEQSEQTARHTFGNVARIEERTIDPMQAIRAE